MHAHLFFAVLTVIALILGAGLHSWVVAANTVNSKLNGIVSYQQYVKLFLPVIMFRLALSWAVFLIYAQNSDAICTLLAQNFTSLAWLEKHPIHASPTIALVYGLFVDSFLSSLVALASKWVPGLKVNVPPPPGDLAKP